MLDLHICRTAVVQYDWNVMDSGRWENKDKRGWQGPLVFEGLFVPFREVQALSSVQQGVFQEFQAKMKDHENL